jgi:hypothetical protein
MREAVAALLHALNQLGDLGVSHRMQIVEVRRPEYDLVEPV